MKNKNSDSGVYWVIGITVVFGGGYLLYKKWYDEHIKTNPAFSLYNWFTNK